MLTLDYKSRISAEKALLHPWFADKESFTDGNADLSVTLANLKNFRTQLTFQKAVLSYLASQQTKSEEEERFRQEFVYLDIDKNGLISKQELIIAFEKMYGKSKKAQQEAEKVMKNLDVNQNGFIDYNGIFINPNTY